MHTRQVMGNVTTNEMINWHRYPGWEGQNGAFKNPYDRGMVHNIRQFFKGYPSCPRGAALNRAEIPLLVRQAHEDLNDAHARFHTHTHTHSHGGRPCQGHGAHGADVDLEAGLRGSGDTSVSGARSRSKSRERQRQEDGHAAGSADTATPGVEEEKALAQQLRDLGFDD